MAEVTKNRETSETTIDLTLNLEDRKVDDSIDTGVGFFDHDAFCGTQSVRTKCFCKR